MSKKGLFTGLLALLLVFALLGCEQVTSGGGVGSGADPNDKWTEVTSLDGLEGTWKGLVRNTQTMPGSGTDTISLTTSTETKIIIPGSGDVSTTIITDFSEFIKVSAETQNKKEQEIWVQQKISQTTLSTPAISDYIKRNDFLYKYWYFKLSPTTGNILMQEKI